VKSLAAAGSLLAGVLTLTVRVLLLLTGLVAAALLLAWLLARILVLLVRGSGSDSTSGSPLLHLVRFGQV